MCKGALPQFFPPERDISDSDGGRSQAKGAVPASPFSAMCQPSSKRASSPSIATLSAHAAQEGGAQRFVVDVRNNGGGSFPAGVEVAKMWLNHGDIVLIADSAGVRCQRGMASRPTRSSPS